MIGATLPAFRSSFKKARSYCHLAENLAHFAQITCTYRLEKRPQPIGLSHNVARHRSSSILPNIRSDEMTVFSRITWRVSLESRFGSGAILCKHNMAQQ